MFMLLVWQLTYVLVCFTYNSKKIIFVSISNYSYIASTALHAVENNYRTVLIEDACRGVNEKEIEVKRIKLNEKGCIFVDSNVVS